MNLLSKGEHDLFILGVILLFGAYFIGFTNLGATLFSGLVNLDLVATGRNLSGNFANYPGKGDAGPDVAAAANAPAIGSLGTDYGNAAYGYGDADLAAAYGSAGSGDYYTDPYGLPAYAGAYGDAGLEAA